MNLFINGFRSLQYAFRWSNVCPGQRFNRNNLTAIILKIMTTFPTMEFIESDLGEGQYYQ